MKEKTIVFDEEVVARGEDLTIECNKAFVYLNEGSAENDLPEVNRIVAKGKVKIIRPDGEGTAEEAVYDLIEQKLVLTGQAVFKQGNDSLAGSKITLFKNEEHVKVEGPVKAVLHPKSEEGTLSSGQ
jgi:lipopolysaccharide transport protein LptA